MTEEKRHSERERRRRSLDRGRDEDRQTRVRRRRKKESRRQAGMLWICPCLVFLGQEFCLLLSVLCRFPSIALPPPPSPPHRRQVFSVAFFCRPQPFWVLGSCPPPLHTPCVTFCPAPSPFSRIASYRIQRPPYCAPLPLALCALSNNNTTVLLAFIPRPAAGPSISLSPRPPRPPCLLPPRLAPSFLYIILQLFLCASCVTALRVWSTLCGVCQVVVAASCRRAPRRPPRTACVRARARARKTRATLSSFIATLSFFFVHNR